MISKSWVISAVLPIMIEAEQYFSFDSSIALATASGLSLTPFDPIVKVNVREHLGVGLGALGSQSHLASADGVPSPFQNQHNVESRASARPRKNHFHRARPQIAPAGIGGTIHHDRVPASAFGDERHPGIASGPSYCAFHTVPFL